MYLDFIRAKNDFIKASRRAFDCGLVAASGGNISVRLDNPGLMLVKPSGITLGECGEDNLLITDLHGRTVEGTLIPTKETNLHGGLYLKYPSIGAVVHLHPVYSIICANHFDEIPLMTKQMKQVTDRPIPVCKIKSNSVDEAGLQMIFQLLGDEADIPCLLLEEHGTVTFAGTAADALNLAELVEENARVYWGMRCMQTPK